MHTLPHQVLELEQRVMDAATRRRARPLAHLPLTSQHTLVELDLSGMLLPEAMEPFAEELGGWGRAGWVRPGRGREWQHP